MSMNVTAAELDRVLGTSPRKMAPLEGHLLTQFVGRPAQQTAWTSKSAAPFRDFACEEMQADSKARV